MKRRRRPNAAAGCAHSLLASLRPRRLGFEPLERRELLSVVPLSSNFRVNTFTTGDQHAPAVAVDGDGDFVVAWTSGGGQDGSIYGIFAQRFNAAGVTQGAEFRVNTYTTNNQATAAVAVDSDGDFVVAWVSYGQDGDSLGIYAQRYNATGVAQGSELRVNTYTTGRQSSPDVAMDVDGDFVVVWDSNAQDGSSYGVYAQRYNASGVAQGIEFRVNTYTTSDQYYPSVAMDADGDFVVMWDSTGQDGSNRGVYAQRYNTAGVPQGDEFRVNTYTTSDQYYPSVAMDADGDFVVTWLNGDGIVRGVYAQRYNAAGAPFGGEFHVNTSTVFSDLRASVATDADGDFVVTWTNDGLDFSEQGISVRRYDAAGVAQGGEFLVNAYATSYQALPAVAMDADGDFVIAWSGAGVGDSGGVFANRYGQAPAETVGAETRANSSVAGNQREPATAMDADGDYVVVWESNGTDGSGYGIYGQRYNAAAVPQGGEFRVNTFTTGHQRLPSVAMDADGDFVVAWQSANQGSDLSYGVYAQRYSAGGTAQGGEIHINTQTTDAQALASIAMDSDGDFVVTWSSFNQDGSAYGVYARRYNAAGVAQGEEFRVNSYTTGTQTSSVVAQDANGDFVIVWQSFGQDSSFFGVYAQRYSASGVAQGSEFRVNTVTTGYQLLPTVALDADGDFVVAWSSLDQDGSSYGVYAQRYSAVGTALGSEVRINVVTTGSQSRPAVAMDADGDFVVVWTADLVDGSGYGVYAWRYPAAGGQPDEFRVNTYTTTHQLLPAVAASSTGGNFVVAWHSDGQDGSGSGIYSQLYEVPETPGIPGDFDDDTDVDANDINILADMIFRGASDPGNNDSANLNGTGGVTQDDMDYMVNTILATVYGDADLDDDVDGADFDAWRIRDSLGGGIGWATGDWDGDNDVDGADFDHWRLRLPAIGGAGGEALAEPVAHSVNNSGATASDLSATGSASAAATSTPRFLSDNSTQSVVAGRAHAARGHEHALAKPVAHERLTVVIDEVLSTSPMYRSRHLSRALPELHDVFAGW